MRPAAGNFDDVAAVLKPGGPKGRRVLVSLATATAAACARSQRRDRMRGLCAEEPGPGVLLYLDGRDRRLVLGRSRVRPTDGS